MVITNGRGLKSRVREPTVSPVVTARSQYQSAGPNQSARRTWDEGMSTRIVKDRRYTSKASELNRPLASSVLCQRVGYI